MRTARARRPKIGLALGAGGARGWAHVGVIRALDERGIRADVVCGTSMGALVGAAYAAGELARLEDWALSLGWRDVFGLMDFTWRGGLIRGRRLFEFMRTHFGLQDIAALPVPYGAVATELGSGREVWLREGPVLDAVRASVAIPGVFAPVLRDGELLVDGGLVNPVPVSMCRALGAEVVIAVDLGWAKFGYYREQARDKERAEAASRPVWWARFLPAREPRAGAATREHPDMPSALGVFFASFDIMQERVGRSRLSGEPADVLVTPILPDFSMMDFDRAREAIDEGRAAAERAYPILQHLLGG
ncbi:MAG: patatin-like phospholipase RssA [Burkholderiales bacterium]